MKKLLSLLGILLVLFLLSAQTMDEKKEIELKTEGSKVRKAEDKQKKVSVFEIVNKLLTVKVSVDGKRLTKEQKAEIIGKVESSIKDCFAKALIEDENYQKREKRLFDSNSVVKVKLSQGVFTNIRLISSKGKSPIVKGCINSLKDFETGFNTNTDMMLKIKTGLK